jgi:hypothetical protein
VEIELVQVHTYKYKSMKNEERVVRTFGLSRVSLYDFSPLFFPGTETESSQGRALGHGNPP